jgi:8-oxo-dGTP pyrophosphatase MutT (NUDIX family)
MSNYSRNNNYLNYNNKNYNNAIISIGIILLKFDYKNILELFNKFMEGNEKVNIKNNGIQIEDSNDINIFSKLKERIKFLLIRRKHTLGYIEFIRGRYKPDNIDGIIFLFQQMTQEEINKIGKLTIEELWDDFWDKPKNKKIHEKEFIKTKNKFNKLKDGVDVELSLDFYINNVKPMWDQAEWGFPKGRKNKMESNLECAKREFEEETGFESKDYIVLEKLKPLVEDFIGTNGIKYRHIYFIACSTNDKKPKLDELNIHQRVEIGDIGYYVYNDVINIIRSYHIERKKIVTKLYMYLMEKIILSLKNNKNLNI